MTRAHSDADLAERSESWLDSLDPATAEWRAATQFRRIVRAREAYDEAEQHLRESVAAARAAGDSWTIIGVALGISRQAAWERFRNIRA